MSRIHEFNAWADSGFQEDKTPPYGRSLTDPVLPYGPASWKAEDLFKKKWAEELAGLDDVAFDATVVPLLDRAARLPERSFQTVLERLHYEFFSDRAPKRKMQLIIEAIARAGTMDRVPDDWWLPSRDGGMPFLDLTADTPSCRKVVGALMRAAFEKEPVDRNHAVTRLLAISPHGFEALSATVSERKASGTLSAPQEWWASAVEHFRDKPDGARGLLDLYQTFRRVTRNACRGHGPSVAKLAHLYAAHPWPPLPIEADRGEHANFIQTGAGRDACLLKMPPTVPGLVLSFGTAADVRRLASVVDWASVQVEVVPHASMPAGVWRSVGGPTLGALDAAFALKNPNALEVWKALSEFGIGFAAPTREEAQRKALMTVAAWQGGRPRIELNTKGEITNMVVRDPPAEQARAAQAAAALIPNTPALWRAAGRPPESVFLTALRSGNMDVAERAWAVTQGLVATERDGRGNAFHAVLENPPTPVAEAWFARLIKHDVPLTRHNEKSELPGDVLARQPDAPRRAWEAAIRKLGVSLPRSGAPVVPDTGSRKDRRRGAHRDPARLVQRRRGRSPPPRRGHRRAPGGPPRRPRVGWGSR